MKGDLSTITLSKLPRFCLVIIIFVIHDVNGDIVTALEDLVEINSLILDLEGRDYVFSLMPMKR
ncbi:MAG TPA: hypothetical protein VEG44_08780 [Candidatus Acidoferrales bacterium]|nr:hypothetical protein [Candidatus Acidoferrales bacterium]